MADREGKVVITCPLKQTSVYLYICVEACSYFPKFKCPFWEKVEKGYGYGP